jgi:hypothetical protein
MSLKISRFNPSPVSGPALDPIAGIRMYTAMA